MNLIIYCNCTIERENILYTENQKNIILNSHKLNLDEKENLLKRNFLLDDTNYNISNLNRYFGSLTGLFWVWKNAKEEYVGTCTYRIFWKDYSHIKLEQNTLIVPKQIDVNTAISNSYKDYYNILDHYAHCHGDIFLKFLYGILMTENTKITSNMIDKLKYQHLIYPFNMFIAHKSVFNKICELLFEVLFLIYQKYSIFFEKIETATGQIRFLDFLAERLLHVIFTNIDELIPNINIVETETIHFPHDYKMMTGAI
jgi:hypothetical protein